MDAFSVWQKIDSIWRSLGGKMTQRYLQLPVTRWWLTRRARTALSRAGTILFICLGNVCRSPFAAHLARSYFPAAITILSAGYFPESGRRAPDVAVATAAYWSVDLSTHRSQVVTEDLIRQADVVFVFDYHNYCQIAADYRFARGRIHFLGALCPECPLFIADPWGQDKSCFERTYQQIAASLQEAAHLLQVR